MNPVNIISDRYFIFFAMNHTFKSSGKITKAMELDRKRENNI